MAQKIDIMTEFFKVFLDFLKKQAGIVFVLIMICLAMGWMIIEQKRELVFQMGSVNSELRARIDDVSKRLHACDEARARLVVQVEVLKVRADGLAEQVREIEKRRR